MKRWSSKEKENRCYNGGKQHKFEPRYDEVPNSGSLEINNISAEDMKNLMIHNIYLFDICVWCGEKVKRDDKVI